MTGQLDGVVDGRPVAILGEGTTVVVIPNGVLAAWKLRRQLATVRPLLLAANRFDIRVDVQLHGSRYAVSPNPHPLIRFLRPR